MKPQEFFYSTSEEMAEKLADSVAKDLVSAIEKRGRGFLVLPGGKSPAALMKRLATKKLPWEKIDITTTDERKVSIDDEGSCTGQVKRILGHGKIHWLGDGLPAVKWPSDVTVLGMGADGHYASIFSDTHIDPGKSLIDSIAPYEPRQRWSLPPDTLANANRLILLVPDQPKYELCKNIITGKEQNVPLWAFFERYGDKIELHIAGAGQ